MTVILHQLRNLNIKQITKIINICEALPSTKNVKHNTDYKDSEYHYKTAPSNKSDTLPSNKRKVVEKETEKVTLEKYVKNKTLTLYKQY